MSDDTTGGGSSMGLDPDDTPDEQEQERLEQEREERLDPENRPENAEVDNTERDFDVARGQFTDAEDYDDSEPPPFSDPEDPNNPDNQAGDDETDESAETDVDTGEEQAS